KLGSYRAVLELPGGEAPFIMDIANKDGRYVLYLNNGSERTRVSNVQFADGELRATFPGYENSMQARVQGDRLEGTVTLIKDGGAPCAAWAPGSLGGPAPYRQRRPGRPLGSDADRCRQRQGNPGGGDLRAAA